MRIGIDVSAASVPAGGTSRYTRGLVGALIEHKEHEFILYMPQADEASNPFLNLHGENLQIRIVSGLGQAGRTLISLSRQASKDGLDIFHSPGYFLPLWNGPKVVTFHDMNMFLEWDMWWKVQQRRRWASLCLQTLLSSRLARLILADSWASAKQTRSLLRVSERRLRVIYPGIDDRFFAASKQSSSRLRDELGLDRYLLFVSVLAPIKNLVGVVQAFSQLSSNLQLVIVGPPVGRYFEEVVRPLIQRLGIVERVKVVGIVDDQDLLELYMHASVLVHPPFAEGFGLPPLEAMACGTPVVASSRGSLPEVLGDAAVFVDPDVEGALVAALGEVLSDMPIRESLIDKGKQRASKFRWSTSADATLNAYAEAA